MISWLLPTLSPHRLVFLPDINVPTPTSLIGRFISKRWHHPSLNHKDKGKISIYLITNMSHVTVVYDFREVWMKYKIRKASVCCIFGEVMLLFSLCSCGNVNKTIQCFFNTILYYESEYLTHLALLVLLNKCKIPNPLMTDKQDYSFWFILPSLQFILKQKNIYK